MFSEYNIIAIPVLVSSLIILGLARELRKYRFTPGMGALVLCLLFSGLYSLFYGLELLTIGLPVSRLFNLLTLVSFPLIPVFFVWFAILYVGQRNKISAPLALLLLFFPAVFIILSLTNSAHRLIFTHWQQVEKGGFRVTDFRPAIGMWIYFLGIIWVYLYSLNLLVQHWYRSEKSPRWRTTFIIFSSLIPFLTYLLYLTGFRIWGVDPIPFSFALMAIIALIGVSKYSILGLAPAVRNILFEKLPDAVLVINTSNQLVDFNSMAAVFFGLKPKSRGMAIEKALENFPEIIRLISRSNPEDNTTVGIKQADSDRFFAVTITDIGSEQGTKTGKMILVRDVTRETLAEKQRREIEEKFRLIVENAPLGIFYYDRDGIIRVCNDLFVKIIGSSRELLIGLNMHKLPDQRVSELIQKTLKGEKATFQGYYTSYTANKTTPLRAVFDGIRDENGQIVGGIGIIEDITDYNRIEEELRAKNAILEQMIAQRDRFFSIIAHDLRSPFSSFLELTELMTNREYDLSGEEIRSFAHEIRNRAIYLFELLENLLEWSRLQRNYLTMKKEVHPLAVIINKSLEIMNDVAAAKNILVTTDISEDVEVYVDERMIQSLFRNLISNAIKFTPRNGKVSIRAHKVKNGMIEIRVTDTGKGISPDIQKQLFRLDFNNPIRGTEGEPSSGLGLILCKEFVEKNQGEIYVESQVGSGTTVIVRLPDRSKSI